MLHFTVWTFRSAPGSTSCYDATADVATTSGHCWCVGNLRFHHHRTKQQVCQRQMWEQEVVVKVPSDWGPARTLRLALAPGSFLSFDHNNYYSAGSQRRHSHPPPFTGKHDADKLLLCSFTTSKTANTPIRGSIRKAALGVCDLLCRGSLPWNLFEVIVSEAAHCVANPRLKKKQQFTTTCNGGSPNAAQKGECLPLWITMHQFPSCGLCVWSLRSHGALFYGALWRLLLRSLIHETQQWQVQHLLLRLERGCKNALSSGFWGAQ